jgi:hypothetical protein
MNLNTRIVNLTNKERRSLTDFAKAWCMHYFGENRRHPNALSVRIVAPEDPDDFDNNLYGWYKQETHRIYININTSKGVKQFLKTFVHEYTHSIQPVKTRYRQYSKVFGYTDNPYEVHARANEIYYKHIWECYKKINLQK